MPLHSLSKDTHMAKARPLKTKNCRKCGSFFFFLFAKQIRIFLFESAEEDGYHKNIYDAGYGI